MRDKFYDVHFHAFNLGHIGITEIIQNFEWNDATFLLKSKIKGLFKANNFNKKNTLNFLSTIDNDLGDYFLFIEHYLKNPKPQDLSFEQMNCKYNQEPYKKIVLCPLVMDFGDTEKIKHSKKAYYAAISQKEILTQVYDLFCGIKFYYNIDITVNSKNEVSRKRSKKTLQEQKDDKLFEIYPFLGLNPINYELSKIQDLLNKFFGGYLSVSGTQKQVKHPFTNQIITPFTSTQLYQNFYNNSGSFDGDVYNVDYLDFIFAGIKLYSPLGFNPNPTNINEQVKVNFIYNFCEERGIPITTHCSTGGFMLEDEYDELSDPNNWADVLIKYPNLKINFAHFGVSNHKWITCINNYIAKNSKTKNVYTDFADLAIDNIFYANLDSDITKGVKNDNKILFGSDFPLCLREIESYNKYLETFFASNLQNKNLFVNTNSEEFLWGE